MDHYLGAVPQRLLNIGRTTARRHEVQACSPQEGFGVLSRAESSPPEQRVKIIQSNKCCRVDDGDNQ